MNYKDYFDRDIRPGNHITYAVRSGNVSALRSGTVVELTESAGEPVLKIRNENERLVTLRTLRNCIIV